MLTTILLTSAFWLGAIVVTFVVGTLLFYFEQTGGLKAR